MFMTLTVHTFSAIFKSMLFILKKSRESYNSTLEILVYVECITTVPKFEVGGTEWCTAGVWSFKRENGGNCPDKLSYNNYISI